MTDRASLVLTCLPIVYGYPRSPSIVQPNTPQPAPSHEGNMSEDLNLHARLRHDVVHHCHIRHEPQCQVRRHLTTFSTTYTTCATNALKYPADHYDLPSGSSARQFPASRLTNLHEPRFVPNRAHRAVWQIATKRGLWKINHETIGYGSQTWDQRVKTVFFWFITRAEDPKA